LKSPCVNRGSRFTHTQSAKERAISPLLVSRAAVAVDVWLRFASVVRGVDAVNCQYFHGTGTGFQSIGQAVITSILERGTYHA
jgi:hypothetical protein